MKILGFGPINEIVFLAALRAVANGKSRAINWVRQQARREMKEYERIAYHEMLSELPETVDELIKDIVSPQEGIGIEQLASTLGATNKCLICNTMIVDPYAFTEAVIQHYHVSELNEDKVLSEVEKAVLNSGVEIGGWDDNSLCAYHHEAMRRDD